MINVPFYTSEQISQLPSEPGVYKFFNKNHQLIYVGKAKNLKKRVSSYFNKSLYTDQKTKKMVSEINSIEFTIVNSEYDALLLENNLIKNNHPRYNILMRDDKSYPFICITNERFPRIYSTRNVDESIGKYYGPFASVWKMNHLLDLIRKLCYIRTCKYDLSEENIRKGKFKVCLEYHIGNCKGPCEGLQGEEDYNKDIENAENILKGNLGIAKNHYKEKMHEESETLNFENAQVYKEKLELLENFQAKSQVVNPKISETDVFTIVSFENLSFINYLKIKNGAIISTKTVEIKHKLQEPEADILALMIVELRESFGSQSKEIITNIPVETPIEQTEITVPQRGDKRKLVDLSIKNALHYKKERYAQKEYTEPREKRILKKLQEDLKLHDLPIQIECFDNSNIQGTNPVASMVCFLNGKPAKKEYRKFNIKSVEGPDDYASMHEVVTRRYSRLLEENQKLPDLVIIDGGKGQLNAATDALKALDIYGKIPIVGIAKKLESIYFPNDPYPLHVDKKSESLKLIQKIRDEAHRFAITFHRQKRSNAALQSKLENIPGIGKKTREVLLNKYKSVQKIKIMDQEELAALIGSQKATVIKEALKDSK